MGHFYTNATLKGPDAMTVACAISRMRRVAGVASGQGDFTVVFERDSERQDGSAYPFLERLTAELDCVALYVTNHDDSVLYYRLYRSGRILDNYDSCPGYFEGPSSRPERGDGEILCDTFGVSSARDRVDEILHYDRHAKENEASGRYVFEIDRHHDLADALGLPMIAVGFGYVYLAEGRWPKGLSPQEIISVRD